MKRRKTCTPILASRDLLHKKIAAFCLSKRPKKLPSPSKTGEEAERKPLKLGLKCYMKRICNGDDDLSKNSAALWPKTFEQGIQVFHETIQQDFL